MYLSFLLVLIGLTASSSCLNDSFFSILTSFSNKVTLYYDGLLIKQNGMTYSRPEASTSKVIDLVGMVSSAADKIALATSFDYSLQADLMQFQTILFPYY